MKKVFFIIISLMLCLSAQSQSIYIFKYQDSYDGIEYAGLIASSDGENYLVRCISYTDDDEDAPIYTSAMWTEKCRLSENGSKIKLTPIVADENKTGVKRTITFKKNNPEEATVEYSNAPITYSLSTNAIITDLSSEGITPEDIQLFFYADEPYYEKMNKLASGEKVDLFDSPQTQNEAQASYYDGIYIYKKHKEDSSYGEKNIEITISCLKFLLDFKDNIMMYSLAISLPFWGFVIYMFVKSSRKKKKTQPQK